MKAIIIDSGDVITYFSLDLFGEFIRSRGCDVEKDREFFKNNKFLYDMNRFSKEEFWQKYIKETGVKATPVELANAIKKTICVDQDMMSLMKKLKKDYLLILASNIDLTTYEETKRQMGDEPLFDAEYISFKMEKLKSDPSFFSDILSEQDLSPKDAIFIDDSPKNVASAESIGIKGIVFKNREQLIEELKSMKWI